MTKLFLDNEKEKAKKLMKYFFLIFIPSFLFIWTYDFIKMAIGLPLSWVIGTFLAYYFLTG